MIKTNEFWIKKMQSFADIKNAVIVKVCLIVYLLVTLILVIISNIFLSYFLTIFGLERKTSSFPAR